MLGADVHNDVLKMHNGVGIPILLTPCLLTVFIFIMNGGDAW